MVESLCRKVGNPPREKSGVRRAKVGRSPPLSCPPVSDGPNRPCKQSMHGMFRLAHLGPVGKMGRSTGGVLLYCSSCKTPSPNFAWVVSSRCSISRGGLPEIRCLELRYLICPDKQKRPRVVKAKKHLGLGCRQRARGRQVCFIFVSLCPPPG